MIGKDVNKTVISSDLKAARELEEHLLREVADQGYSEAAVFAIKLSLEEGLNNAIRHGNRYDPRKQVEVTYDINERFTEIIITDQGEGFNPVAVPDPTADENLEKPDGRGIMLMKAYMDRIEYNGRGNQIHMVKCNT